MPVPGGNVHGHLLVAVLTLGVAVAPASAGQGGSPVLFDRGMTVGAGATVSATLGETIARAEDAIVPARLFNERGVGRRAANITYRVSKLLFFDLPQEQWLLVVNHEVMGHGARLRERFDGFIGYTIDPPAPYGPGGGTTFFRFDREPTIVELQAVTAGGMEANAVAARVVADRAFSRGQMRVRDAIRYLGFELDTLTYILGTDRDLERESRGHDVAQFLRTYNAVAQEVGAPGVSVSTLRREALVSLANPMIAIAAYGIGRYLWNGAADAAVPALSWGGVRYLPLVRYQLAPYGMEWAATTHISSAGWPTRIEVRAGRSAGAHPWGVGIERRGLATWRAWNLDLFGELWRQPDIAGKSDASPQSLQFGMEIRGRAERPFLTVGRGTQRVSVIVDIGVKTAGFVPGEPLGGGLVVRAGVGIPLK